MTKIGGNGIVVCDVSFIKLHDPSKTVSIFAFIATSNSNNGAN